MVQYVAANIDQIKNTLVHDQVQQEHLLWIVGTLNHFTTLELP